MKEYKYIHCHNLKNYKDWDIVQIIPKNGDNDMVVISKKDVPIQNYIKLNEATNEQLLEELLKRLTKENR